MALHLHIHTEDTELTSDHTGWDHYETPFTVTYSAGTYRDSWRAGVALNPEPDPAKVRRRVLAEFAEFGELMQGNDPYSPETHENIVEYMENMGYDNPRDILKLYRAIIESLTHYARFTADERQECETAREEADAT